MKNLIVILSLIVSILSLSIALYVCPNPVNHDKGIHLTVISQYTIDDEVYCDYELDGDIYTGVYYEDMMDNLNNVCAENLNK